MILLTHKINFLFNQPTYFELVHIRPGFPGEPLRIAAAIFFTGRCLSCHTTNVT